MKTISLTVNITFEDDISDDNEVVNVMENVANAIEYYAGGHGIAPESSETYTNKVIITNKYTDDFVIRNISY